MRDEIMNKKKKSRGVGPNEQKVHLSVSMLDIRNEWNVLNIFIQLGSERGDATFVGYDLSISTSMTSLKSLANSYCLTTLVSSFKSACALTHFSASPGIILAFICTLHFPSLQAGVYYLVYPKGLI
ncbi:hypothetical protein BLNAU_2339 [Blattamonas nauphoetae]|uniref:Uncharacterized protein n=1 Tax=Blattamonas nauphoetae TaxID=2049346 RepID=A0ABQ9YFG3_9EUKA|nr:hypothetical protein BLNAU_2339 [Blattamonas nauphoetae]